MPTGSDDVRDTVQTVNGLQRVFVDQSIQLGSGDGVLRSGPRLISV